MKTAGRHLLLELGGCDPEVLATVEHVRRAMLAAAAAIGATVIEETFHRFSPHGISGVVVIAESHLTIHAWPESGYAAVDVFTCGDRDPNGATGVLVERLRATSVEKREILRGLPGGVGEGE